MTSPYVRLGGSALVVAVMFVAGAARAQAPKTAAPAAGQPGGPVKLDLIAMQSPWTKLCAKDPSTGKETCYTTRDFGQAGGQGPTLAMAVYSQAGEDKRNVRLLLPLGLLIRPGFRMTLEKGEPIDGKYGICFPTGCFAEAEINGATLAVLKKTTTVGLAVRNQANAEITFNIPMKDFAAAFEGPPIDPKVLEQQNQELQRQLEEKARAQREQLEKSQGAAQPTPPPAATPAK